VLFIGEQSTSQSENGKRVADAFRPPAGMPCWNGSHDDRVRFRRIGAELNIASEGRQRLRSIDNRGTIKWHQGLLRYPENIISGQLLPRKPSEESVSAAGGDDAIRPKWAIALAPAFLVRTRKRHEPRRRVLGKNNRPVVIELTCLELPVRYEERPRPYRRRSNHAMEDAMTRPNFWSKSAPRVELDHRARDARVRLVQTERLLVPRGPVASFWLSPFVRLLGSRAGGKRRNGSRGDGSQSNPRLDCMSDIETRWLEAGAISVGMTHR
jgi:hypothetical protein